MLVCEVFEFVVLLGNIYDCDFIVDDNFLGVIIVSGVFLVIIYIFVEGGFVYFEAVGNFILGNYLIDFIYGGVIVDYVVSVI